MHRKSPVESLINPPLFFHHAFWQRCHYNDRYCLSCKACREREKKNGNLLEWSELGGRVGSDLTLEKPRRKALWDTSYHLLKSYVISHGYSCNSFGDWVLVNVVWDIRKHMFGVCGTFLYGIFFIDMNIYKEI